jgi:hypothetical protein
VEGEQAVVDVQPSGQGEQGEQGAEGVEAVAGGAGEQARLGGRLRGLHPGISFRPGCGRGGERGRGSAGEE